MNKLFFYTIVSIFFLLGVSAAMAQKPITVSATVDKQKLLIGEHAVLTLTADIPENQPISFFNVDTIPHFEFLEEPKTDTSNTSDGTVITQVIRITSFDSGHWVIPAFYLADSIGTDTIPVDVVFSEFDPKQPYHDINDIMDVEVKEEQPVWWWYAIGGGVLLSALILYLLLRKKKKPAVVKLEPEVDAYDDALQKLKDVEHAKLETKQYYSILVDIFRQYVYRRKGIQSLQKTTDDLVLQLKDQLPVRKEQFDALSQMLRLSDFVKFAKYQPSPADDKAMLETIREAIQTIEQSKTDIKG